MIEDTPQEAISALTTIGTVPDSSIQIIPQSIIEPARIPAISQTLSPPPQVRPMDQQIFGDLLRNDVIDIVSDSSESDVIAAPKAKKKRTVKKKTVVTTSVSVIDDNDDDDLTSGKRTKRKCTKKNIATEKRQRIDDSSSSLSSSDGLTDDGPHADDYKDQGDMDDDELAPAKDQASNDDDTSDSDLDRRTIAAAAAKFHSRSAISRNIRVTMHGSVRESATSRCIRRYARYHQMTLICTRSRKIKPMYNNHNKLLPEFEGFDLQMNEDIKL